MAIIGNAGTGVIEILTTDTVIYQLTAPTERYCITQCSAFNPAAIANLEIYISPDLTSAAGQLVAKINIGLNEDVDINALLGLGTDQNVIAKASAVGINLTMTKTEYTEGS